MTGSVSLGAGGMSAAEVVAVARDDAVVSLSEEAREAMERSAAVVAERASSEEPAYGISTGFGSLAMVRIPAEARAQLQRALVRSHAAGMGPPVEREVVRAMMVLRARTLAMGCSGARPLVAERILALLRRRADARGSGARVVGGERRSRSARALRFGADRGGVGGGRRRGAVAGGGGARPGRDRADRADRQGGARADQRHRRDARDARARLVRSGGAAARRRRGRGDVGRGAARDRPGVRRGPDRAAAATGAGGERRESAAVAGGFCDRRQPSLRRPAGPGRVLAAVRAPGLWGGPGRGGVRPRCG